MLMLKISISLARSIRRMHSAGLAHSDLSNNNVLIDPKSGSCVVIDIDSLVVPGLYPPEVAGTRGYIAPEVLMTMEYPYGDPRRSLPCIETDLHSMAVLIYEYLLNRHPLIGPKHLPNMSSEDEDFALMGSQAVFIENPTDKSNRPDDLKVTIHDLGPHLEKMFLRAFVDGLHSPKDRPTAMDWERSLVKTWDLLYPCDNPNCQSKWFILLDANHPVCPFCGTRISWQLSYWGLIESLPDANFLVMYEYEKCGSAIKNALTQHGIYYCSIDDFCSAGTEDMKRAVLFAELEKHLPTLIGENPLELTHKLYEESRVTATKKEMENFCNR